jgi:hypothetical protein
MKSGNLNFLEPSGQLQGCKGTALPFIDVNCKMQVLVFFHCIYDFHFRNINVTMSNASVLGCYKFMLVYFQVPVTCSTCLQMYVEFDPSLQSTYQVCNNLLSAFAELRKAAISSRGTTRLPLDGFSLNFILEYFSKICR